MFEQASGCEVGAIEIIRDYTVGERRGRIVNIAVDASLPKG